MHTFRSESDMKRQSVWQKDGSQFSEQCGAVQCSICIHSHGGLTVHTCRPAKFIALFPPAGGSMMEVHNRVYSMGPIFRAMVSDWDQGEEMLKSEGNHRH